jgi:hypothetical protein
MKDRENGNNSRADAREYVLNTILTWRNNKAKELHLAPETILQESLAAKIVLTQVYAKNTLFEVGIRVTGIEELSHIIHDALLAKGLIQNIQQQIYINLIDDENDVNKNHMKRSSTDADLDTNNNNNNDDKNIETISNKKLNMNICMDMDMYFQNGLVTASSPLPMKVFHYFSSCLYIYIYILFHIDRLIYLSYYIYIRLYMN